MPSLLITRTEGVLVGKTWRRKNEVVNDLDPKLAEKYVNASAGVIVPADYQPAPADFETADHKPTDAERATLKRK